MKITDPEIIENGEKDLIDAVKDDLDWDSVKEIIKDKMAINTLESSGGQIVVHNNQIAFRIDFSLNLKGSLMFDREGNYISEDSDSSEHPEVYGSSFKDMDETDMETLAVESEEPETVFVEADDPSELDESLSSEETEDILKTEDPVDELQDELAAKTQDDQSEEKSFEETDNIPDIMEDLDDLSDSIDIDPLDFPDDADSESDDVLNSDINDILEESRQFWEQKKETSD